MRARGARAIIGAMQTRKRRDVLLAMVPYSPWRGEGVRRFAREAGWNLLEWSSLPGGIGGWRGDGVGEPHHMTVKYPNAVDTLGELWKKAPVSFESFWWLGEWERKGWDIDEMIEKTLAWNASTFNAKSFPIPEKWRDKVERWVGKMGYHFVPRAFEYPSRARAGETLMFSLEAENVGVAPIYNAVPLRLRLKSGGREFVFDTGVDVRKWLPGPVSETFCVKLPEDALPGEYIVGLSISNEEGLIVRWEAKGELDGAFLNMGSLRITE